LDSYNDLNSHSRRARHARLPRYLKIFALPLARMARPTRFSMVEYDHSDLVER